MATQHGPAEIVAQRLEEEGTRSSISRPRVHGTNPTDLRDHRVSRRFDLERLHSAIPQLAALAEDVRQPLSGQPRRNLSHDVHRISGIGTSIRASMSGWHARTLRAIPPVRPAVYRHDLRMYSTERGSGPHHDLGDPASTGRHRPGDGRSDAAHGLLADPQLEPRFLDSRF